MLVKRDFAGTLLDFGCGLGDAFPVYREHFPCCNLIGVDHSEAAIQSCRDRFGSIATFRCGAVGAVSSVGIVVASNVIEHVQDDHDIVRQLLARCNELYVFVPYKEQLAAGGEHVNRYTRGSFGCLPRLEVKVFASRGWSQFGRALIVGVYLKNLLRPFFGRKIVRRNRQIMFRFKGQKLGPGS